MTGSPPTSSTAAWTLFQVRFGQFRDLLALLERNRGRGGNRLADFLHALAGRGRGPPSRVDRVERRARDLDVVPLEDALLCEFGGDVQPGLAAQTGDDAVGSLLADDLSDGVGRDRLDVDSSAISGSVMIVAGFELTRTTRAPSSRSARQACAPE